MLQPPYGSCNAKIFFSIITNFARFANRNMETLSGTAKFGELQARVPVESHAHAPGIYPEKQRSALEIRYLLHIGGAYQLVQIDLFVLDPADVLVRQVLQEISTLYSFFRRYFSTSNCRTPTTPTMISSIPVWNSWKI